MKGLGEKQVLFFVVKFFLIFFVLTYLIELVNLNFFTTALASLSAAMVGALSLGSAVITSHGVYVISNACTGFTSASILAAVVFSLRKPRFSQKVWVFVAGTIVLLLLNIPRLALVLFAAQNGWDADLVHTITWFLMSAAVLLLWYFGTKRIAKVKDFSELV